MKTIFKITAVFAFVAFSNILFAAGNLKVNIHPLNSEKAVVDISSLSNSNFSITVANENNNIVYYKENSDPSANYSKVFDFSNLSDGKYKLVVAAYKMVTEREFQKHRGTIEVGEETTTLEPFFFYKDGLLKCTYLNFMNENLNVSFYDTNDERIYSKKIGRNFNVLEGFNLSKLDSGSYRAVLTAGNKAYAYNIEK
jgi:hypothetical protein